MALVVRMTPDGGSARTRCLCRSRGIGARCCRAWSRDGSGMFGVFMTAPGAWARQKSQKPSLHAGCWRRMPAHLYLCGMDSGPCPRPSERRAVVEAAVAVGNRSAGFPRSGGKRLAVFRGTGSFRSRRRAGGRGPESGRSSRQAARSDLRAPCMKHLTGTCALAASPRLRPSGKLRHRAPVQVPSRRRGVADKHRVTHEEV